MENTHEPQHGGSDLVDPLAHLALLNRSKGASEYDHFLYFGPRWYALLFANVIAGLSLWGGVVEGTFGAPEEISIRPAALALALLSTVVLGVHSIRNDRVKAKPTIASFLLTLVAVFVVMGILAMWGIAISAIGWDEVTFLHVSLGWAFTTGFFLALRFGLHRVRDSRRVAAA